MYSGYKVVSCKNELGSLLRKLGILGYRWGNREPLENADELRHLLDSYKIGEFALVFKKDTKQVYYCRTNYVSTLDFEG